MSTCSSDDTSSNPGSPIAYRPATPAQTGRHSGSYFDAAGPWIPHLGHSFVGLKGGRSSHDQEHAFTISSSNISVNPLATANLGQRFQQNYTGLSGRPKRETTSSATGLYTFSIPEDADPRLISVHSPSVKPLKTAESIAMSLRTLTASSASQISSDAKQRERPPGDRTAGHRRFCRICHVCSSRTWSQTHCISLPKSSGEAHANFLRDSIQPALSTPTSRQVTQKMTGPYITIGDSRSASRLVYAHLEENRDAEFHADISCAGTNRPTHLVQQNSFINADKAAGESIAESTITRQSASQQSHYHGYSQQDPSDLDHVRFSIKVECDDPMCRATHDGHHPYRHSIACTLHRGEEAAKCRGLHQELPVSDFDSDASRPLDHAMQGHHSTALYHSHDAEHSGSGSDRRIHELYTSHKNRLIGEARPSMYSATPVSKSRSQPSRPFETKHVARGSPRYEHSHETIRDQAVTESEVVNRTPGPAILIPKGRLLTGDARSRLRHVIIKSHGNVQESQIKSYRERFARHLLDISINSSQDLIRTSAPSPLTALHITQHQRPGSWLGHSSEHVHSGASDESLDHAAGISSTSHCEHLSAMTPSHGEGRPAHLHIEDSSYSQGKYLSPLSAYSITGPSHSIIKESSRASSSVHGHSWDDTVTPESRHPDIQDNTPIIRENERYPSSSMSRLSHSPLQPRQILMNVDESTTSEGPTSALASDFEIHRPSPIAPPNHDCNWKDRYLALAAEIRLLKAELSTRASLAIRDVDYTEEGGGAVAIDDDDDLGIESITIIIHLRGRDDMVINTDLTQGPDLDGM
ncbi:hypothetical protein F5Y05DRAFT_401249 [Hypoxylon sp. FL0543]|nr:hypothetical protein F5Y05DRAFT_401249 [Hypoxylon sp. FL0543]